MLQGLRLWPPRPLGLGTPLNLALLAPHTRARFARGAARIPVAALATALAILAVDQAFFAGATLRRTPDLNAHPPLGSRVLVTVFGSLIEELLLRVVIASAASWLAYMLLPPKTSDVVRTAQWIGTLVGAVSAALLHIGLVSDAAHTARLLAINLIGHTVYGVLYWRNGLEAAVTTHAVVTALLFIAAPALR